MGFVVVKMTMTQVISLVFVFSTVSYEYFIRLRLTLYQLLSSFFIIKPTRCTNFTNLFWHETLHVSDSSTVHQLEFIRCTLSNDICYTGL